MVSEFHFVCSRGLPKSDPRNHTKSHEQSRFVWLRGSFLDRKPIANPKRSFTNQHFFWPESRGFLVLLPKLLEFRLIPSGDEPAMNLRAVLLKPEVC